MTIRSRFPATLRTAAAAALLCASLPLAAQGNPVPAAPELSAGAFLVLDYHSGRVLAEKNADTPMEPASLTKIMTSYVVLREIAAGHVSLEDTVTVSRKAWRTPGSRTFIEVGSKLPVEVLLKGMIVQSGNDASVALAEFVAGSEDTFAQMMNTESERLGMSNTHFTNSTGLPDEDMHTTARDLATLTSALIRDFPEKYTWYSIRKFTYNDITQYNRNKLLWRDDTVDGVKTGYTEGAGYCLVTSAVRNDMRLITVVLNTRSVSVRTQQSQALLNYGFRFFETHRLYGGGEPLTVARIWKGSSRELPVGLARDLYVTIPRKRYEDLSAHMDLKATIHAPIAQGAALGMVHVKLGDDALTEKPVVALKEVPEGSIWRLLADKVLLLFH
jgi:D-alanyl-D-alanine carboxypeptidase (penicillin-binding protein 5/6)